ncbi:MAG: hypothetical protein JXA51_02745, partial [Dehalococcoidales bacterium]|nr:hypothetical protein [Dehalococcoidales bacterium]
GDPLTPRPPLILSPSKNSHPTALVSSIVYPEVLYGFSHESRAGGTGWEENHPLGQKEAASFNLMHSPGL